MTDETTQKDDVAEAPVEGQQVEAKLVSNDPPKEVDDPADHTEPRDQFRAQPIRVDGRNRQSADAGLEGGFVRVKNGKHQGRVGVFLSTLKHAKDGFPERILFRSRDAENEHLDLAYDDVEACHDYRGGR